MSQITATLKCKPEVKVGDTLYLPHAIDLIEIPGRLNRNDGYGEDFFYQFEVRKGTVTEISRSEWIEVSFPGGNTYPTGLENIDIDPNRADSYLGYYFHSYEDAVACSRFLNRREREFLAKFNEENGTSLSFEGPTMLKQMDIIDVFRVLLDGGCVCRHDKVQGRTEYRVMRAGDITGLRGEISGHISEKHFNLSFAGYISEKRFNLFIDKGVLESTYECGHDKYGNVSRFYMLPSYARPIQEEILQKIQRENRNKLKL